MEKSLETIGPKNFTELQKRYNEDEDLLVAKFFTDKLQNPEYVPTFDEMRVLFTEFVCSIKKDSGHHEAGIDLFKKEKIGDLEPQNIFTNLDIYGNRIRFDAFGNTVDEDPYSTQFIVPQGDKIFPKGVLNNHDFMYYALAVVGKKVFKRAEGTKDYDKFISWYLGDYERFIKNIHDPESQNLVLDLALSGLNRNGYSEKNLYAANEIVKSLYRMSTKKDEKPEESAKLVDSILGMPSIAGYFDSQILIIRGLVSLQNTEAGDVVTGYVISRNGLASTVDRFRKLLYSQDLNPDEKLKVRDWLLNFWRVAVPASEHSFIPQDVNDFYSSVPDGTNPMTEKNEGDNRIVFLLKKMDELQIARDELILDIAGGNGWLADRMKMQGYNVEVVDNNEHLVEISRKRGVKTYHGNMLEINHLISENKLNPKVEIINGRSIHHINKISDLDRFKADVVIFDVLDPNTGIQGSRLNKIRDYLVEKHGFDRKWVDKYYWNILSSIDDGKYLMDRFCPPEEWWVDQMNYNGYQVEVTREYNYDKKGTDNLVVVCKKITDLENKNKIVRAARDRIQKRQDEAKGVANAFYRGSYADWGY